MKSRLSYALGPFAVRSFRFQWPADLLTSWAIEMEGIILGWYIIAETGSVFLLTLFGSLQYIGTLVAPMFGVMGDRIGHRNLLCAMRAAYFLFSSTIMILAFSGVIRPAYVLIVAGLMGMVRPSDLVMRNSLIGASMPPAALVSAASVARTTMDSARIAGALAGAGLFAALGMGKAYLIIATLYALSFCLTLGVYRGPTRQGVVKASPWRDLSEGIAYVWTTPSAVSAMALAFLVNLTAFPLSNGLLPYVAREIYRIDQQGLGFLVASFACGSLIGSLVLTVGGRSIRPGRMMLVSIVLWYALLIVFTALPRPGSAMLLLLLAGFVQSLGMVPMSVILLRTSEDRFRGRVMGVRMLAVYGLPVGLLAAGALIDRFGFTAMETIYCITGIVFTLAIAMRWHADLWHVRGAANVR
ncbi:MAG TPA: MFS transporter [Stellaceae bacterium]|nr:MFS transporter [Stellaceae bacterium]